MRTATPETRALIFWYAIPAGVSLPTKGSPWLVEMTIFSSSGTTPIKSTASRLATSSTDIISPRRTISMRTRLTMREMSSTSFAAKSPMIRSASRIADTSGVVTTIALSAAAMAFLKPCSIPAGQSSRMKSKSSRSSDTSFLICWGETADLSLVCADGSRYRDG